MDVCFLNFSSRLLIAELLTSELIDTPVFHNLAPKPIKYRVSVPIPSCHGIYFFLSDVVWTSLLKVVGNPSPVAKVKVMGPVCSSSLFFLSHLSVIFSLMVSHGAGNAMRSNRNLMITFWSYRRATHLETRKEPRFLPQHHEVYCF